MKTLTSLILSAALALALSGCSGSSSDDGAHEDGEHTHADGTTHDGENHAEDKAEDEAEDEAEGKAEDEHAHDEVDLGSAAIGDMEVTLAQGHGAVEAGKEGHLVVKLPYTDNGATIVRAWIGTDDRTLSFVGKGQYAPSHDDYDIHAMAPDPLPEDVMWWIEVEAPDGTMVVASVKPIMK